MQRCVRVRERRSSGGVEVGSWGVHEQKDQSGGGPSAVWAASRLCATFDDKRMERCAPGSACRLSHSPGASYQSNKAGLHRVTRERIAWEDRAHLPVNSRPPPIYRHQGSTRQTHCQDGQVDALGVT